MRCPNPICREIFEVREDAATPPNPPETYRLEGEPSPAPTPKEPRKPAKSGSISDVVPLLEALSSDEPTKAQTDGQTSPENGSSDSRAPSQRVASWQDEPPAPRVASWRDEPPSRRADDSSDDKGTGPDGNLHPDDRKLASANPGSSSDDSGALIEEPTQSASAADYVPHDGQPNQRELDSLETMTQPRSRKALILSLVMVAGVIVIVGGVTIAFIKTFVDAETKARTAAEKSLTQERFSQAAKEFSDLISTFSSSSQKERYQFLYELSKLGEEVNGLQPDPDNTLSQLNLFVEAHRDDPLLKDHRKLIASFYCKMAENLGEFATTNKDDKPLESARIALNKSKDFSSDPAQVKSIAEKLDQQAVSIVLDQKRLHVIDELNKVIAAGPTVDRLKVVRVQIHRDNLDSDSEIGTLLRQAETVLRAGIRYVEANEAPARPVADPIEPSLLVMPFTSKSPQPKEGAKRVVLALDRGVLYALDQATGKDLWALRVGIDTTALPVRLPATGLSPERFLVLSADRNTLMALTAQDGSVAWRHTLSAPCLGRPAVDSAALRAYVPTYDGRVNEIELSRGVLLGYFELHQRLSLGAVLQDATDCLFVPGDSDSVFILDVARTQEPGKPPRKRSCIGILSTGHPSGSLRSEPLVLERVDLRHVPAPGTPAPGYLVLCQTDGYEKMRLRVFGLPLDSSDEQTVADKPIGGWSWFEPCHDPEKLAFVTDTGLVGLFGINQLGNDDEAVFALNREPIRLGSSDSHLVRGQVVHVQANDFWIVAGGRLQRYHFDLFGREKQLVRSPLWPEEGVSTGAPIHAGQMDENNSVLVTVSRDLSRQITLATAVDARNGKMLWQKQLGVESQGDPVTLGTASLIVDRSGAILMIDDRPLPQIGPGWRLSEKLLAEPLEGMIPGTMQLVADGPTTLHQLAVLSRGNKRQLIVRTIRSGVPGQQPTVELSSSEIASLPQGSAAVVNGALIMPLAEGSLHQFKLPLGVGQDRGGPDWRSPQADDDARGHVVSLGGDEFLCTDGSRKLKRWTWPAAGNYKPKPLREMPARIVTAPLVQLPASEKETGRVWVADAQDNLTLLNGTSLATEKAWKLPGRITAGLFVRAELILAVVDRKKLVCIDPTKDDLLWQHEMKNDEIVGEPCLVDGMLILASPKGRFVGLDPRTGQQRGPSHTLNASAAPTGTPVAAGPGGALVPLTDGTVFFLSPQLLLSQQAAVRP
jgi:outer membrane protein assembly factor BamB